MAKTIYLLLGLTALCGCPAEQPAASSTTPSTKATATATTKPTATTAATASAKPTATAAAPASTIAGVKELAAELKAKIPKGSGDYSEVQALAKLHKDGKITFEQLTEAIVARKLPPHKLGDKYLLIPVPKPPNPKDFNPGMMPKDWEGNFGEVAMAMWLGELTREQYNKLHAAAHPDCNK